MLARNGGGPGPKYFPDENRLDAVLAASEASDARFDADVTVRRHWPTWHVTFKEPAPMSRTPHRARTTLLYVLFSALILTGIAMKRLLGHPEWLPAFHIGALIVLVGISLSRERGAPPGELDGADETPPRWDDV